MKPILKVDKNIVRVSRGGSWDYSMQYARGAIRHWRTTSSRSSNLGFRLFEGMR